MAVHSHHNQRFLNRLGVQVGNNYAYLTYAGNQPDGRYWTRDEGVCAADGTPLNVATDPNTGVTAPVVQNILFSPMRVSPNGTVYSRELLYDNAGLLVRIGPEKVLAKPIGTSVFQQYGGDAVMPLAGSPLGASDEFFTKDGRGLVANTDFPDDAETVFMRANGAAVQLKPLEGEPPAGNAWPDVAAAFVGSLNCMYADNKLYGFQNGAMPMPDGETVAAGMRILVDQQLRPQENGIYMVTAVGDGSTAWELSRAVDAALPAQFVYGKEVAIAGGVIRGGQTMRLASLVATLGASEIVFESKQ
jgi:hypothetical protein